MTRRVQQSFNKSNIQPSTTTTVHHYHKVNQQYYHQTHHHHHHYHTPYYPPYLPQSARMQTIKSTTEPTGLLNTSVQKNSSPNGPSTNADYFSSYVPSLNSIKYSPNSDDFSPNNLEAIQSSFSTGAVCSKHYNVTSQNYYHTPKTYNPLLDINKDQYARTSKVLTRRRCADSRVSQDSLLGSRPSKESFASTRPRILLQLLKDMDDTIQQVRRDVSRNTLC